MLERDREQRKQFANDERERKKNSLKIDAAGDLVVFGSNSTPTISICYYTEQGSGDTFETNEQQSRPKTVFAAETMHKQTTLVSS